MSESHDSRPDTSNVRPSWQTSPCPAWCTETHHERDRAGDRLHLADAGSLPMSFAEPIRVDGSDDDVPLDQQHWEPGVVEIEIVQEDREVAPRVVVVGLPRDLTADEAVAVAETLMRAAETARCTERD